MKHIDSHIRHPATPAEHSVVAALTAQLAALRPDQVRITLMHSESNETSYNPGKGEWPKGPSGKPTERFFTAAEVIGLVPFLLTENANHRGYNIFITPFSEPVCYILLDDVLPQKMAELEGLRLTPQMLIESSPQRFQGIYLLPKEMATKDEANGLFRLINARHGDPKISGLTHPFRAAGFKNRKPKYQKPNGFYPFAGMILGGKLLPEGLPPLLEVAMSGKRGLTLIGPLCFVAADRIDIDHRTEQLDQVATRVKCHGPNRLCGDRPGVPGRRPRALRRRPVGWPA